MNEMDISLCNLMEKSLYFDGSECSKVKLKDRLIRTIRIPGTESISIRTFRVNRIE
jgi:hypothetical protein